MIKFNCDNCEMEIELDDAQAGTKHECLQCGDINRVPQASEPTPNSSTKSDSQIDDLDTKTKDRAAAAGYPADFGPETKVMRVRRCWFRSRVIRFSSVLAVALVGVVGMIWVPLNDRGVWWYLLFGTMTAGGFGLIVWWWLDRFSASLEITTKRTIMHRGIFSKSSSEIVHDNIRNIQVTQSFLQRVTNVGKIGISSSGQDGVELEINHLRDPGQLRTIVDLYRPI
jgi:Bacterial PH domain